MHPAAYALELERLAARVTSSGAADIPQLIDALPPSWSVEYEGEALTVSSGWIARALDAARKEPQRWADHQSALAVRLHAARHEAATLVPAASSPDLDRSRRIAAGILARDEFRRNASDGALDKLRRRLTDWLVALWNRLGGNRLGTRRATTVVAWGAALAALAALTWWLLSQVLGATGRSGLALTPPVARRRSARAWAKDAAAAQDPRETIRFAYRAAVASLEEEGAWRVDDARTPREHLRLLPAAHRRRPVFADLARRFEDVWFGARTPTADDRRTALSRLEELGCLRAE